MTAMENLGSLWNSIQAWLFPMPEDELGKLDETHRKFVAVCELCSPQAYVDSYCWVGSASPPAVWLCAKHSSPKLSGIFPLPATRLTRCGIARHSAACAAGKHSKRYPLNPPSHGRLLPSPKMNCRNAFKKP